MSQLSRPRWSLPLAIIAIAIGILVIASPIISRTILIAALAAGALVTAWLELMAARRGDTGNQRLLVSTAWLVLGVLIAFWPGHSLRILGILVGAGLLMSGIVRLIGVNRGIGHRLPGILIGAAAILLGIVAIGWADITIVVVTAIFGGVLVIRGLALLLDRNRAAQAQPRDGGYWLRTVGAGLALAIVLTLLGTGSWLRAEAPKIDDFYDAPDTLPAEPGVLLRSEPYTTDIPDGALGWRILYSTTRDDDTITVASGVVVTPETATGPSPVIAWAHGTTGYDETCAPSSLRTSFESGAMFVVDKVVEQGWTMVATDYIGLGTEGPHPYLIGRQQAHSVLDAVRAARQLDTLNMGDQTVVWGHSQGGHAALWTGIEANAYAPDVNVIGVAALAPASNLPGLMDNLLEIKIGSLFSSYVVAAYSEIYDDVAFRDLVNPGAEVVMRELASRCLESPNVLISVFESLLVGDTYWAGDGASGDAFRQRLNENVPSGAIDVPLLIGQGLDDELVLPTAQEAYVTQRCGMDDTLDYRTYEGHDHLSVVKADSPLIPDLIQWTHDRFDGLAAPSTC